MATQKQLDANRRNSTKSTGPVTDDGKKQSRRNALKHGLAGSGLVLPHDESAAVEQRMAEWNSSLKPFDPYETWLLEVVAVESIRVDRCRIQERVLRDEQTRRACESWDDDQRQSASELAAKLARDPSVVAKLSATIPGASLLLDRWRALSRVIENGDWTAAQEALALDLLGTPIALRDGVASPFFAGISGDALARRRDIVSSEMERLEHLISEVLPARNATDRDLVKAGIPDLDDRGMVRLHRYETRCFRRLMWATQQMQSQHRNVTSSSDRVRESDYSRPLKEVSFSSNPAVVIPARSVEPPVYQRPLLQHAIGAKAFKFLAAKLRESEVDAAEKVASKKKTTVRKDLPSPNDRPSRR